MERPFKAYDKDGTEYSYTTALDARQACEFAGYTLTKPGEKPKAATAGRMDYDNMNSDAIRQQCLVRGVVGYMTLDRKQQIAALRERDKQDEEIRLAGLEVKAKKTSAAA